MKSVLSLDETPSALESSISAANKLKSELPTNLQMESIPPKELSSLVADIPVVTRKASQKHRPRHARVPRYRPDLTKHTG